MPLRFTKSISQSCVEKPSCSLMMSSQPVRPLRSAPLPCSTRAAQRSLSSHWLGHNAQFVAFHHFLWYIYVCLHYWRTRIIGNPAVLKTAGLWPWGFESLVLRQKRSFHKHAGRRRPDRRCDASAPLSFRAPPNRALPAPETPISPG